MLAETEFLPLLSSSVASSGLCFGRFHTAFVLWTPISTIQVLLQLRISCNVCLVSSTLFRYYSFFEVWLIRLTSCPFWAQCWTHSVYWLSVKYFGRLSLICRSTSKTTAAASGPDILQNGKISLFDHSQLTPDLETYSLTYTLWTRNSLPFKIAENYISEEPNLISIWRTVSSETLREPTFNHSIFRKDPYTRFLLHRHYTQVNSISTYELPTYELAEWALWTLQLFC